MILREINFVEALKNLLSISHKHFGNLAPNLRLSIFRTQHVCSHYLQEQNHKHAQETTHARIYVGDLKSGMLIGDETQLKAIY